MRYALLALLSLALFSCSEESCEVAEVQTQEEKTAIYDAFLTDLDALKDFEGNPVPEFKEYAEKNADAYTELHKSNAEKAFADGKNYKHVFIVYGDHTVVRIVDFDNCTMSGSWGVCMPLGAGYIRKGGDLNYKNAHVNNIISKPDQGEQIIYYFNE
jgi:hypothetical protein